MDVSLLEELQLLLDMLDQWDATNLRKGGNYNFLKLVSSINSLAEWFIGLFSSTSCPEIESRLLQLFVKSSSLVLYHCKKLP